jgi:hypothetical protein
MVAKYHWIPTMARREPGHAFSLRYQVPIGEFPADTERRIEEALRRLKLRAKRESENAWNISMAGQTLVYGLIRREVDETVLVAIRGYQEGSELVVRCAPRETHNAHAAGLGGVLLIAAVAWMVGGWTGGILPALTALIAGSLVVEVTRQWAFDALERRLNRIANDVGSAVWPRAPAQVLSVMDPSHDSEITN